MDIRLEVMTHHNLKAVFEFERDNKEFFEQGLPPRASQYFEYDSFLKICHGLLEEQKKGECKFFLIYFQEEMVGRINFSTIKELKAELGYRISRNFQGRGVASKAVELVLDEAKKLNLNLIEAGTSASNIGSQKVLTKNGFEESSRVKDVMKVNNVWIDGIVYIKSL